MGQRLVGRRESAHFVAPPSSRTRGSSSASAMSEISTDDGEDGEQHQEGAGEIHVLRLQCPDQQRPGRRQRQHDGDDLRARDDGRQHAAMSDTKKFSDMRKGYFISARRGGMPLARAVTTYCFSSSSSRLARTGPDHAARPGQAITTTGSQMCLRIETNLSQLKGWLRYSGSISRRSRARTRRWRNTSPTSASRKCGMAMPRSPRKVRP